MSEARGLTTLVITEESATLWTARREQLGLGPSVHIASKPFRAFPTTEDWEGLIARLAAYVSSYRIDFVIFDTLSKLWPVSDENDAGKVIAAVMPLQDIMDLGAAVMFVHHPRKGDAGEGQASRGSGALPGAVDIQLEFRRHTPADPYDRRRVLTGYSRFEETQPEMVIELGDDGYRIMGNRTEAGQAQRLQIISEILSRKQCYLSPEEILGEWPTPMKPGKRAVEQDLEVGLKRQLWQRTGRGVKGDGYRFARFDSRNSLSLGARNESSALEQPEAGTGAAGGGA